MSDPRLVVAFDHKLFYAQASANLEITCKVVEHMTREVDAYIMIDLERGDVPCFDTNAFVTKAAELRMGVMIGCGRHSFAHVYVVDSIDQFTKLILPRVQDVSNACGIVWSPEDLSAARTAGLSVANCDGWQCLERLIRHATAIRSLQCDGLTHLSLLEGAT